MTSEKNEPKIILRFIELQGFKSFANPTHIDFSNDINVITAPNGCGKSNLLTVITWTLFDFPKQSPNEIIFYGNENIPASEFAEVLLSYETEEEENLNISIKRIIARDGNQSFFLNDVEIENIDIFQEKTHKLKLPEICLLDDFDKDFMEKNITDILLDFENRRSSKQTIVVLHNKQVISAINPNRLIGLTMEETGVSKAYSIQFEKIKEKL